jgi:GTP cyclohydrolase II
VIDPVQAAAIRRRIRIPLGFADGYSTTATVVSFAGLADAQQHVALERGPMTDIGGHPPPATAPAAPRSARDGRAGGRSTGNRVDGGQ